MGLMIAGRSGAGQKTAAAGTVITQLLPPKRGCRTVLDKISVLTDTTAHTLTAMQCLGVTTLSAAAAASQAVINLTADPGPVGNLIAANDYLVIEKPDGTFHVGVVSSVSTLAITLTANVPAGGFASGARVWNFGIISDTVPIHGGTHPSYALAASTTNVYDNASGSGVIGGNYNYEPVLLHIGNATAASTIKQVSWIYTVEGYNINGTPVAPDLSSSAAPDADEHPETIGSLKPHDEDEPSDENDEPEEEAKPAPPARPRKR